MVVVVVVVGMYWRRYTVLSVSGLWMLAELREVSLPVRVYLSEETTDTQSNHVPHSPFP